VFDPPVPATLLDAAGDAVTVSGRGEQSAPLATLRCDALPDGGGMVVEWSGPWPYDLRWWDRFTAPARWHRGSRWQAVVATPGRADGTGVACLVTVTRGHAAVEALYD
jgi:protein ImuB